MVPSTCCKSYGECLNRILLPFCGIHEVSIAIVLSSFSPVNPFMEAFYSSCHSLLVYVWYTLLGQEVMFYC